MPRPPPPAMAFSITALCSTAKARASSRVVGLTGAWQYRNADVLGHRPRSDLVAKQAQDFDGRSHENKTGGGASGCEFGVFAQESITRVDSAGPGFLGDRDDRLLVEIGGGALAWQSRELHRHSACGVRLRHRPHGRQSSAGQARARNARYEWRSRLYWQPELCSLYPPEPA